MLNLDDEEVSTLILALEIATQEAGESMGRAMDPSERCCQFCVKLFAALRARLLQYQQDMTEERK